MKRHWYTVKISYKRGAQDVFVEEINIGLVCQSDILRTRVLKKAIVPAIISKPETKRYLCNGQINITVNAYLGKFNGGPNLREVLTEKIGDLLLPYFVHAVRGI